jgi:hypothetical protein
MTDLVELERRVAALEHLLDRLAEAFQRIQEGMERIEPLLLELQTSIERKH